MSNELSAKSFGGRLWQGVQYRMSGVFKKRGQYGIAFLRKKILKHEIAGKERKVSIGRHIFHYSNPLEILHCYDEIFQKQIYRFQSDSSSPLIIDCGANMGAAVVYFKDIYPQSAVIAFEPDDQNFDLLQKNTGHLSGVSIHKKAVWIKDGMIAFEQSGTLSSHIIENDSATANVEAVKLSAYLEKPVDFLKIDIEGAEYEVLKDIAGQLHNVKNLFIEYHGLVTESAKLTEMMEILRDAGFCIYIKEANDPLEQPFFTRRTPSGFEVQLNIFCYRIIRNDR